MCAYPLPPTRGAPALRCVSEKPLDVQMGRAAIGDASRDGTVDAAPQSLILRSARPTAGDGQEGGRGGAP